MLHRLCNKNGCDFLLLRYVFHNDNKDVDDGDVENIRMKYTWMK